MTRLSLLLVATALAVSGCYRVTTPVLTNGEYAPVAGNYACVNRLTGERGGISLTQTRDGFFWPSYRYDAGDGIEVKFASLSSTLYLGQTTQNGTITLGFLELTDAGVNVLVVNTMTAAAQIDKLASQNAVAPHLLQNGFVSLAGNPADIKAFLSSHPKNMLTPALTCTKLKSPE